MRPVEQLGLQRWLHQDSSRSSAASHEKWGSHQDALLVSYSFNSCSSLASCLMFVLLSGVLFHDLLVRQGILDSWVRSLKLPFILGSEAAGEIVGVGRNVADFKVKVLKFFPLKAKCYWKILWQPGDRVMALPERKAWAEYVVCKAEHCFRIPDEMNYDEAVALTVDGMVSYALLFEMGGLTVDDPCGLSASRKNVLMHSAAGGLVNRSSLFTCPIITLSLFRATWWFNCFVTCRAPVSSR